MRILTFTDAHIVTGVDLSHMDKLGRLIVDERPDKIIQLGDFVSVESLSHWDQKKKLLIEGRRYEADIAAANEAINRMFTPLADYNATRRENKKAMYRPDVDWFFGNHEYWVDQYVEQHPELHGHMNLHTDLNFSTAIENTGCFKVHDYPHVEVIDNIGFMHAPRHRAGVIAGKYVCARALDHYNISIFFGHTHRKVEFSIGRVGNSGGIQVLRAMTLGCFFVEEPEYTKSNSNDFWRGAHIITTYPDGTADIDSRQLEHMR